MIRSTQYSYIFYKSPSPGTFSPINVTGLQNWYKAESLSLASGTGVQTWTDSSGNGRDATQSSVSPRPTFISDFQNGYPAVSFDGLDDYLSIPISSFNGITIFVAAKTDGAVTGTSYVSAHTTGNDYDGGDAFMAGAVGNASNNMIFYWRGSRPGTVTTTLGSPALFVFTVESAGGSNVTQKIRKNGSQIQSHTFAGSTVAAPTGATIGARFQPTVGGPYLKSHIFELAIYNTKISAQDIDSLEVYFNSKYNLY